MWHPPHYCCLAAPRLSPRAPGQNVRVAPELLWWSELLSCHGAASRAGRASVLQISRPSQNHDLLETIHSGMKVRHILGKYVE